MRLLHLSDLHLRLTQYGTADKPERLSRKVPELLQRLGAAMSRIAPDVIAITGDLLDVPKPLLRGEIRDEALRREMISAAVEDYIFVRRWLEQSARPFVVLPGNHDLFQPFYQVFAGQPMDMTIGRIRLLSFHDWEQAGNIPYRLNAQRELFDRSMSDDDRSPQIHLQHYLTQPFLEKDYPYNYADAAEMAAKIQQSRRVIGVFAGHYHEGALLKHESGVCYSVVPGFCIAPHPYRIVDIDENVTLSVREYRLEEALLNDEPPASLSSG